MSLSYGGDGNQDRQEDSECPDGDYHDEEKYKETLSGPDKQKEEDVVETVLLAKSVQATECPLMTIIKEMEEMFSWLGFSQTIAIKLVDDQVIDSP